MNICFCDLQKSYSGMDPASGVQRGDLGGQSGSDSEAAELPLPRELGPEDVVDHTPIQEGLPSTPAPHFPHVRALTAIAHMRNAFNLSRTCGCGHCAALH